MSDHQPSADEWQGVWNGGKKRGGGGVKKERKQNNWFCRLLERVQTGHREPRSATRVHGIESAAFRVLDFSTASSKTEEKKESCILKCLQGRFTLVCFFFCANYLLSLLLSQEVGISL